MALFSGVGYDVGNNGGAYFGVGVACGYEGGDQSNEDGAALCIVTATVAVVDAVVGVVVVEEVARPPLTSILHLWRGGRQPSLCGSPVSLCHWWKWCRRRRSWIG